MWNCSHACRLYGHISRLGWLTKIFVLILTRDWRSVVSDEPVVSWTRAWLSFSDAGNNSSMGNARPLQSWWNCEILCYSSFAVDKFSSALLTRNSSQHVDHVMPLCLSLMQRLQCAAVLISVILEISSISLNSEAVQNRHRCVTAYSSGWSWSPQEHMRFEQFKDLELYSFS